MFITEDDIRLMEQRHGWPKRLRFGPQPMLDFEYGLLIGSMKDGRRHDATMFIGLDGGWVCIQKPSYAGTGIFRAPSGGLKPGETIEEGLRREMREETGLEVAIERFLLVVGVEFIGPDGGRQPWTSYVFSGRAAGGALEIQDRREISGLRVVSREEMLGPVAAEMEASGWGGFLYRARLTREAFAAMDEAAAAANR